MSACESVSARVWQRECARGERVITRGARMFTGYDSLKKTTFY